MAFLHPDEEKLFEPSMALPVTRHALNPPDVRFLACGIDTLDLGIFVRWGSNWPSVLAILDRHKQRAQKEKSLAAVMPSGRAHLFHPGGKGESYRYHLEFPGYHLFFAKTASAEDTPNVYLSLNSKTIWQGETDKVIAEVKEDISTLGGCVERVKVSRCDVCADFLIPAGLSYLFLQEYRVARSRKGNPYFDGDTLETYYVGAKAAPIQMRIYDKAKKILKDRSAHWFLEIWQIAQIDGVWRVEFQLRRSALKQFGVNSLDDLHGKLGGIWQHLTSHWFSLRLPDNDKPERRTIHPFWLMVQDCAPRFGPVQSIRRTFSSGNAPPEWHIKHIAGLLPSFAAQLGIFDRQEAFHALGRQVMRQLDEQTFFERTRKKALQLGILPDGMGGRHE